MFAVLLPNPLAAPPPALTRASARFAAQAPAARTPLLQSRPWS